MLPVIEKKKRKPSLTNMTNIFKSWVDLQVFFKGKYKKKYKPYYLNLARYRKTFLKYFTSLDHFFMALQVAVNLLL